MKLIANQLGGSSKLVRDFIRSENFAARFLPNNTRHDDKHFFDAILKSKGDYSRLREVKLIYLLTYRNNNIILAIDGFHI